MISTIDEILQRLGRGRRGRRTQSPAPIAHEIPVGASDASQVRAKDGTETGGSRLRRVEVLGATIIESNASTCPVYGRQWRLWDECVCLLVQSITAFGESDHRRILAGAAGRVLLNEWLQVFGGQIREIAGNDGPLRGMDFSY